MATRTRPDPGPGGSFADLDAAGPVTLPSLGPTGWLRWAWRQLTSMRTALLLLFLLAVAAVPGSILPQNRADPTRVADYLDQHRIIGPWLNRLGFFDVYSSVWFSAIYLLLFVSLVGCVIPRTRLHWRALRAAPPRTPRRLDRLAAHVRRDAPPDLGPDDVLAAARTVLRRRRYRIAEYGGGEHPTEPRSLGAERGYLAETGNLVFHLALVALLGALAWGSVANYSGQAVVVEQGTFANSVINYDSFSAGTLVDSGDLPPFSLTLTDFLVEFEAGEQASQLGSPREFRATLRVTDRPGADPRTVVVQPNHPLDVDGARVYLVGNGYAPILTVTDGNGDVAFRGPVITTPQDGGYKSLAVVKVPDAKPRQIALVGVFLPTYDLQDGVPVSLFPQPVDPRLMFQVFLAHPGEDGLGFRSGVPQSVMAMNPAQMTRATTGDGQPLQVLMAPGSQVELPDGAGTVRFDALVRYAALDIRHDPSKIWALTTSLLALAGVTASLFVRRRRVWVRAVSGSDGRTVVEVAGLSRDHDATLADEVAAVAESVTKDATRERT